MTGAVSGTDGSPPSRVSCTAYLPFQVDLDNKTIVIDESHYEFLADPEVVIIMKGAFSHPKYHGCFPFTRLVGQAGPNVTINLNPAPFNWTRVYQHVGNETITDGIDHLRPGDTSRFDVNQTHGDSQYNGFIKIHNIGTWPMSGITRVDSQDEFLARTQRFYQRQN